jgi:predicted transglutaminase-like cysteine proteinase
MKAMAQAGAGWRRQEGGAAVLGLLVAALLLAARPADAAVFAPSIFGSKEIHATSLKMFPKWRGAMERFAKELQSCPAGLCNTKAWAKLVEQLKSEDLRTKLKTVNTVMNRHPYILDIVNWGVADYWETPFEFLRKNGDCEDYAIAKFYALRDAGVSTDNMRIVVLNDLNLGLGHAILVVYVDGTPLVLDNQIRQVVPAASIRHYKPVYSVNDKGWWLHRSS